MAHPKGNAFVKNNRVKRQGFGILNEVGNSQVAPGFAVPVMVSLSSACGLMKGIQGHRSVGTANFSGFSGQRSGA